MKELVEKLIELNKTVATMESCSGGAVANEITNVDGSSKIIKFSAVTYSNEYKIKMGVDKNIIDKYTVYSMETACEMSKHISDFANSNYGIGITGKLNRQDEANPYNEDDIVYISIYDKEKDTYYKEKIKAKPVSRTENKQYIISKIVEMFKNIL